MPEASTDSLIHFDGRQFHNHNAVVFTKVSQFITVNIFLLLHVINEILPVMDIKLMHPEAISHLYTSSRLTM